MTMNITENLRKNTNSRKVVKVWRMHEQCIPGPSFPPPFNYFHGKGLGARLDANCPIGAVRCVANLYKLVRLNSLFVNYSKLTLTFM